MQNNAKRIDKYIPDYVVFDLETTGISSRKDKIVEISALKVVDHKVDEEFSTLVNPKMPIPFDAMQVNNITDEMVADAPLIDDALSDFLKFVGDSVLLGQNIARFDLKFIRRESLRIYGTAPENDFVDTLPLAKAALPGLPGYKMTDLAAHFGISTKGAHRALADCYMTYHVYEKLGPLIEDAMAKAPKCKKCGSILKKRKGKYGEFWGCSNYPQCTYTKSL